MNKVFFLYSLINILEITPLGFNIYLQGANADRVNSQLKREKVQKYKRNESQGAGKDRKNWNPGSRIFSDDSVIN